MKRFHHFDDGDVRAVVDELMIGLGGVGPAPGVSESVELRLAHRAAWLAEEDVVVRVRIKWRIEIDKIDTRIRELAPVAQSLQIVAEVQAVHSLNFIASVRFDNLTRPHSRQTVSGSRILLRCHRS